MQDIHGWRELRMRYVTYTWMNMSCTTLPYKFKRSATIPNDQYSSYLIYQLNNRPRASIKCLRKHDLFYAKRFFSSSVDVCVSRLLFCAIPFIWGRTRSCIMRIDSLLLRDSLISNDSRTKSVRPSYSAVRQFHFHFCCSTKKKMHLLRCHSNCLLFRHLLCSIS